MEFKTSESHPIRIAELHLDSTQKIGLSFCPGKYQPSAMSGPWKRNLGKDLDDIKRQGYDAILTLIEPWEIEELGVEGFINGEVEKRGMKWLWVPIVDGKTPTDPNGLGLMEILTHISNGGSVFVHCKGGLGRAGTVVAWLLTHFGRNGAEAIQEVRQVRKGAIENTMQEEWIYSNIGRKLPCQFSVLTFNVHNPRENSFDLERISDLLENCKADVIVLTECGINAFNQICRSLKVRCSEYAPADYWGNGILSRYNVIQDGGYIKYSNPGEVRSACIAEIKLNHSHSVKLIGTHLEVMSEEVRLMQIKELDREIGISDSMLVGDFYSVCLLDYEGDALSELLRIRLAGGRKSARWDVMRHLFDDHNMIDSAKDASFKATTPYSSRVDYILCGPNSRIKPTPSTYKVIECINAGISDHQAVMCTFDVI